MERCTTERLMGSMVAVLEIGAFSRSTTGHTTLLIETVTSLMAAYLADNYGRRMTLRIGALLFTIGGAIQTCCWSYNMMIVGRITSGFGVGMLSMVVPIYQVGDTVS